MLIGPPPPTGSSSTSTGIRWLGLSARKLSNWSPRPMLQGTTRYWSPASRGDRDLLAVRRRPEVKMEHGLVLVVRERAWRASPGWDAACGNLVAPPETTDPGQAATVACRLGTTRRHITKWGSSRTRNPSQESAMAQAERVEVLVLGSGAGGKLMAWDMAKAGHRTAVVERKWIGGSCPNVNCLPSKNEVKSAEVADVVHHAGAFGTVGVSRPHRPGAGARAQAQDGRRGRQPAVHARLRERLSHHPREPRRRRSHHPRARGPLLRVHRSAASARGLERGRSAPTWRTVRVATLPAQRSCALGRPARHAVS